MINVNGILRKTALYASGACMWLTCGCTQNDGHIGPIFGSWALTGMTQDGRPLELGEETVFSFQNEVVKVVRLVNPPYTTVTKFGNFTLDEDVLTLKFQSGPTSSGSYMYVMPDWLHFPKGATEVALSVRKLTGKNLELSLDDGSGRIDYTFTKTW